MAFKLTDLPYADSALDPAVSAETLSYHHGKHHQAYVDKTNKAIEGTGHADKSLEEVIAAARGNDQGLFNNSAQAWNHGFYWHSMAAEEGSISDELQAMIDKAFGSTDELKKKLAERGAGHFRLWLIGGPNMGGKSTFLRQNALILLLAQAGSFVPAEAARIGIADRLFSRVGASDNLARGETWKYSS